MDLISIFVAEFTERNSTLMVYNIIDHGTLRDTSDSYMAWYIRNTIPIHDSSSYLDVFGLS